MFLWHSEGVFIAEHDGYRVSTFFLLEKTFLELNVMFLTLIMNSTNINKNAITSPLNWTHWTQKRPKHMTLEIQVIAWDRDTGLNWLMGPQPSTLDNWISNGNAYINKRFKTCTDSLSVKKTTCYHKNVWQNKPEQYNIRVNYIII